MFIMNERAIKHSIATYTIVLMLLTGKAWHKRLASQRDSKPCSNQGLVNPLPKLFKGLGNGPLPRLAKGLVNPLPKLFKGLGNGPLPRLAKGLGNGPLPRLAKGLHVGNGPLPRLAKGLVNPLPKLFKGLGNGPLPRLAKRARKWPSSKASQRARKWPSSKASQRARKWPSSKVSQRASKPCSKACQKASKLCFTRGHLTWADVFSSPLKLVWVSTEITFNLVSVLSLFVSICCTCSTLSKWFILKMSDPKDNNASKRKTIFQDVFSAYYTAH